MARNALMLAIPMISKLAGIASIGGSIANVSLIQRFLSGLTSIIAFTVLSALMAGMLIVCAFYGAYAWLLQYGMDQTSAVEVILGLMFFLTAVLASVAYWRLQELRKFPTQLLHREVPGLARVSSVVNAFLDGFHEG